MDGEPRFTEAQTAFILRQAEEGTAVGEVCRKAGISEAIYYNWRKKYVGLKESVEFPAAIRVDQGTEFVSRDLDLRYGRGRGDRTARTHRELNAAICCRIHYAPGLDRA
jgi:putative transposase